MGSKYKKSNLKFLNDGREYLVKNFGLAVCRQTVKNYLNGSNLKCFSKRNKPELSDVNIIKRKRFAEQFSTFSYFDWKKVIWSDESKFCPINTNKKEFYWSKRAAPLKEENIRKTRKFNGGLIMLWGCITSE
jgi:hypothetical protein